MRFLAGQYLSCSFLHQANFFQPHWSQTLSLVINRWLCKRWHFLGKLHPCEHRRNLQLSTTSPVNFLNSKTGLIRVFLMSWFREPTRFHAFVHLWFIDYDPYIYLHQQWKMRVLTLNDWSCPPSKPGLQDKVTESWVKFTTLRPFGGSGTDLTSSRTWWVSSPSELCAMHSYKP